MSATAGQIATAGRIPGERIATEKVTSDSADFTTTETTVISVDAAVISGRTYGVWFHGRFGASASDNWVIARTYTDATQESSMEINARPTGQPTTAAGQGMNIYWEFTAASTATVTVSVTGQRTGGSGNVFLEASSSRPAFLFVDYVSG